MAGFQNHHAGSIAEGIAIRNAKRAENIARHDAIRAEQNRQTQAVIDDIGFSVERVTLADIAAEAAHRGELVDQWFGNSWDVGPTWDDSDGYVGGTWEDCENPF